MNSRFYKMCCGFLSMVFVEEKRGLIGMIILGVLGFLVVVGVVAGVYFYNFYVFKEVRACVGEGEDTMIPCEVREDCLEIFNVSTEEIKGAPDFIRVGFDNILESAIYCEGTCFVGMVRGFDAESGNLEWLEECEEGEKEFVMEIRGKEGLEALKWMKSKS